MKKIALIGSTGSIGRQTLEIVGFHPDKFKIVSLAAGENAELFYRQVKEFKPLVATMAKEPENFIKEDGTEYFFGENAFTAAIIKEADIVVVSLVGFKGIIAVIDAIEKGKDVALANKESLVVGGEIVMPLAKKRGVNIYPVDSEHSAVWQSLGLDFTTPFNKIILTCSGGAFRDYDKERLKTASAKAALNHPNWNMGDKITVDCATLVNKGFEVIEARWLFNADFSDIDVIIHKESVIHSMVEYKDGSTVAQMGYPDMKIPIQLALSYPERLNSPVKGLDFAKIGKLTFEKPDKERFPCLDLVIEAGKKGRGYPAVINGANEECVKLFLKDKIKFCDIYGGLRGAAEAFCGADIKSYDDLYGANLFGVNYIKEQFGG